MKRRVLTLVLFAGLLTALMGQTSSATEADSIISDLLITGSTIEVVLKPQDLPPGTLPANASVKVTLDGTEIRTTPGLIGATGKEAAPQRTVILVLDTSGSMRGLGLQNAQRAATSLLADLPPDVSVGIIRFADNVELLVTPTRDRALLQSAIDGLVASGNTRLYDSVPVALAAAGSDAERRVVIVSDGADDGSTASQLDAVQAVTQAGTVLDVVDVSKDGSAAAGLIPLAQAGGGRAISVGGEGLAEVFRDVAGTYQASLRLTSVVPASFAGKDVQLKVTLVSAVGPRSDTRMVSLPPGPSVGATPARIQRPLSFWMMLGSVFLGTLLLIVFAITTGDTKASGQRRTRKALSTYTMHGRTRGMTPAVEGPMGTSQLAQSALSLADRVVERRGSGERLALALDRAGMSWKPNEWLVVWAASTVFGATLISFILGGSLVYILVGAGIGWALPRFILSYRAERRQKSFLDAMPEALQLLSASLATGYSLAQALDAVVQEGSEPLAGEFGRALAEARVGLPLEGALESVADRMQCEDFRWVVMAVRVQREVGGNLAEVLSRVCTTMRDRASLRRQVRSLSAEGRISAYVLVALPLCMGAFMFLFRRDYFRPMYTETVGIIALIVMVFMLLIGITWMNKLVKVEM